MTGSHYSQHNIDIFVELHNKASTGAREIEQDMKKAEQSTDDLTRSAKHNSSQMNNWSTRASKAVKNVGQGFVDGGHKMQDFGAKYRTMSLVTLGFGAKLAETQSKYTRALTSTALANDEYQDGTKTLGQVTEETKNSIDKLSESFKAITKQEMAEQFLEISRAGFTGNDAINVMEASMRLSTATGEDLGYMTEILIRSMGAFGLSSESAGQAATNLAAAANASTMDVGDMTQALNMVGAVAHDSGLTLKETSDAIGYMHDKGIKASTGARSLRTVLAGLNETGSDQNEIMQELGMEVDELGKVKYSNLADFVQKYQQATKNMSDEEKANAAIKIAGKEAYAGFLALTSEAGEAVDEYGNKIEGSTTTLESFAEETAKFTEGDLKNMQQEIENADPWLVMKTQLSDATLALAQELAPTILEVVKKLTEFAEKLQDPAYREFIAKSIELAAKLLAFTQVVGGAGKFVSGFGHIVKGAGSVLSGLGKVSSVVTGLFGKFGGATTLLGGSFGLAVGKAALIAAAITALIAVVVKAYKENEQFREIVDSVFAAVAGFVKASVAIMKAALDGLINIFKTVIEWVKKLGDFFGKIFGKASKDVEKESKKIGDSTEKNTKKAKDSAEKNAKGVGDGVDKGTKKASESAKRNTDKLANDVQSGTARASKSADANAKSLASNVDKGTSKASSNANKNMDKMAKSVDTSSRKASTNFNKNFGKIGDGATKNMDKVTRTVSKDMGKVASDSSKGGTKASGGFRDGFKSIVTNSSTLAGNARSAVTTALSGMNLYNYGYNAMVSFANGMNSAMTYVYQSANYARSAMNSESIISSYSPDGFEDIQMSAIGFGSTPVATVMGKVNHTPPPTPNVLEKDDNSVGDVNIVIYETFDGEKITRVVNDNNAKGKVRIRTVRGGN